VQSFLTSWPSFTSRVARTFLSTTQGKLCARSQAVWLGHSCPSGRQVETESRFSQSRWDPSAAQDCQRVPGMWSESP